jgi:hypothetical protein
MKRNKNDCKDSKNVLDNFILIEEPIDLFTQKAYFSFSGTIDFDNVDYKEILTGSDKLFYKDTPVESKKKLLILLAHRGTPEAYRIIEKFVKSPEAELRDWALLSLKECRMFLESILLEEEGGLISTGLGGKGSKLRYYFIVGSKDVLPFSDNRKSILRRGFETISHKYKAQIEEFTFEGNYAMIRILIPISIAVGDIIEGGISKCNQMGEFLSLDYYVTNVGKPTHEEISTYLEQIKHGEK